MENKTNKQDKIRIGVSIILKNFTLSMCLFILPIILINFIPFSIFTFLLFIEAFAMFGYIHYKRISTDSDCMLVPFIMARTILAYSIFAGIIELLLMSHIDITDNIDMELSYKFPILTLAPLVVINSMALILFKGGIFCKLCQARNGFSSDRSYYGAIHNHEILNLVDQIFALGILLTIFSWAYFIFFFNSANISSYDNIVFVGVPIAIVIIHVVALLIRCITISLFKYKIIKNTVFKPNETCMRILTFYDDRILLNRNSDNKFDTPFILYIPFEESYSVSNIADGISEKFHIQIEDLRVLSINEDTLNHSRVIHSIAFLKKEIEKPINGDWFDSKSIELLFKRSHLIKALNHEIYNIFVVLKTLKTYDEDGTRRYRIKGYNPTLTVSDVRDHKDELNNRKWMMLALRNEDNYNLKGRKFWYKYIEGILD